MGDTCRGVDFPPSHVRDAFLSALTHLWRMHGAIRPGVARELFSRHRPGISTFSRTSSKRNISSIVDSVRNKREPITY